MNTQRSKLRALFAPLSLFVFALGIGGQAHAEILTGAGSSAAAPMYRAMAEAYGRNRDFQLVYEPAGSTAGLKKIKAGEVDFGASDVAPVEQDLANEKLVLVPTFITGVVPVVNLPRVPAGKLRLNGQVLAGIFLGKIQRWNAPDIQKLNAGINLPDLEIKPVVRSDGSGTTYYFSDYLAKISPEWKGSYGVKTSMEWPGSFIGAKGSTSVAKAVKDTAGAIGYIDFNYVADFNLNPVELQNASGNFVHPSVSTFRSALRASEWTSKGNFHSSLANMQGNDAWPITMGTFVLLPKVSSKPADTSRALRFLMWAMLKGDSVIETLSLVRLPDKLQATAYKEMSSVTDQRGKQLGLEAFGEVSRQ